MSSHKRAFLLTALIALVLFGSIAPSEAQVVGRSHLVIVGGYYGRPFALYDPWWGYGGYQWGPYPYPPYPPYRYAVEPGASVRLEVKPKEAEVYVDGYYAGLVDDFDGVFQRLHVSPGEHDITLYLAGYRATTQKVRVTPYNTFKIKYTMERLAPGQAMEPRPQPVSPAPLPQAPAYLPPPPRGPAGRGFPPPPPPGPPNAAGIQATAHGTLAIRVQPSGAEVLIDGQPWRVSDTDERLVVEVAEGRHTIEIRKSGYRTLVTEVNARRGETTPFNFSLRSQNEP